MATEPKPVEPGSDEAEQVRRDFEANVNMAPAELEDWLETEESRSVGQSDGDGESVGHASGRRIVKLLRTNKDDLSGEDLGHMKKVNGYVSRHLEQRPDKSGEGLAESKWARSLKNWGHDPTK